MPPKAYVNHIKTKAKRFPFSFYFGQGYRFLWRKMDQTNIFLKEGAVIETINGVNIKELFQHLVSNMSADGF